MIHSARLGIASFFGEMRGAGLGHIFCGVARIADGGGARWRGRDARWSGTPLAVRSTLRGHVAVDRAWADRGQGMVAHPL
jgi:hypothetical protein